MACWQHGNCLKAEGRSRVHVLSGSRPHVTPICIEMVQDKNRMNQDVFLFPTHSLCNLLWIVFFFLLEASVLPFMRYAARQMESQALSTCLIRQFLAVKDWAEWSWPVKVAVVCCCVQASRCDERSDQLFDTLLFDEKSALGRFLQSHMFGRRSQKDGTSAIQSLLSNEWSE